MKPLQDNPLPAPSQSSGSIEEKHSIQSATNSSNSKPLSDESAGADFAEIEQIVKEKMVRSIAKSFKQFNPSRFYLKFHFNLCVYSILTGKTRGQLKASYVTITTSVRK